MQAGLLGRQESEIQGPINRRLLWGLLFLDEMAELRYLPSFIYKKF